METNDEDETGYLTAYGVMIVPPSSSEGGWFVTLAEWDEKTERYTASMDGPMFDSEEEAFDSARDLLKRIEASGENHDLMKMWEMAQAEQSADEPGLSEPQNFPPLRW